MTTDRDDAIRQGRLPQPLPGSHEDYALRRPNGTIRRDNTIGSRRPDWVSDKVGAVKILRGGPEKRGAWRYITKHSRIYVVTGMDGLETGIIDATLWLKIRYRWRQVARWRPGIGTEPLA